MSLVVNDRAAFDQQISFDDCVIECPSKSKSKPNVKLYPTDVDAFFECRGKAFVFTEVKHVNWEFNERSGQTIALVNVVDALNSGGAKAVLLFVRHEVRPPEVVALGHCWVESIYDSRRVWSEPRESARDVAAYHRWALRVGGKKYLET